MLDTYGETTIQYERDRHADWLHEIEQERSCRAQQRPAARSQSGVLAKVGAWLILLGRQLQGLGSPDAISAPRDVYIPQYSTGE